jgi:hypothetical protein
MDNDKHDHIRIRGCYVCVPTGYSAEDYKDLQTATEARAELTQALEVAAQCQRERNEMWHELDKARALLDEVRRLVEVVQLDKVQVFVDQDKLAEEYGLRRSETGWECINCRYPYSSPEDRALKPVGPGGCPGCIHKAKWG